MPVQQPAGPVRQDRPSRGRIWFFLDCSQSSLNGPPRRVAAGRGIAIGTSQRPLAFNIVPQGYPLINPFRRFSHPDLQGIYPGPGLVAAARRRRCQQARVSASSFLAMQLEGDGFARLAMKEVDR